ncbi:hypothetical protein CBOM_05240 [Ceraceosorus bombacis]|uniref:Uncharacterized protein n=1 Tax=Ceraceosorus bombacis TaxID=401625 RepID=A0A0P1BQ84_9BASI|nr:hypothetical protein CBOM_05240 [Ceraceosorus bombacis]
MAFGAGPRLGLNLGFTASAADGLYGSGETGAGQPSSIASLPPSQSLVGLSVAPGASWPRW